MLILICAWHISKYQVIVTKWWNSRYTLFLHSVVANEHVEGTWVLSWLSI